MPASLSTLERLAAETRSTRSQGLRMLVIVNPYATTVSDRLKNLVVYALRGRYEVEAIDTQQQGHAIELCREAAREGYDVVVAFGGDGTVNEAANGLAGTGVPLTCLPGGATNVYGRVLGIPPEIVDATEHLLSLADDWRPRQVDLGRVNGRHFAVSCGVGLDASVVERVDRHPRTKARLGQYYFTYAALTTFARRYLLRPPQLQVAAGERTLRGVTAIAQNTTPYTYFSRRPVELGEDTDLGSGLLSGVVLRRASPVDMPTLLWRGLSKRARMLDHRQIEGFSALPEVIIHSADERPVPLQVDGDYIGDTTLARLDVVPDALAVVS